MRLCALSCRPPFGLQVHLPAGLYNLELVQSCWLSQEVPYTQALGLSAPKWWPGGESSPLGGTFANLTQPGFNTAGEVVFTATITEGSATQGLFLASRGQLFTLVAEGDPTPVGGTFALSVGMSQPPVLNDRGEVAFSAAVRAEQTSEEDWPVPGVFVFSQGQVTKAVLAGDPSPLGGSFLGGPISFLLQNDGTVLFMSIVDTDGDGYPNNQSIFTVRVAG